MERFSILELAVIYSALNERFERLEKLHKSNDDIKLKGEIELTNRSMTKVKDMYLSLGGDIQYLR